MSPESPEPNRTPLPDPLDSDGYHARQLEIKPKPTTSNHRRQRGDIQPVYPWMLIASTALAGLFCYLYLTKPVIALNSSTQGIPSSEKNSSTQKPDPNTTTPPSSVESVESVEPRELDTSDASPYEETNLRIQHVLSASGPAGEDLGRITLNVPVLYQSGQIRWTPEDIQSAQSLLQRINQHQQKAQQLRQEAVTLIGEWDELMIQSVPEPALRADSPTLPENQGVGSANASTIRSTDAIKIDSK